VLDSKREQSLAEARAALEEQTRLALWRMDAAGSAIVLRENQRLPGLPNPAAAEVRARFTLADGSGKITVEVAETEAAFPPLSPAACTAAVGMGELTWQAVPKDNRALKQQVAARSQSIQQQRYDTLNQSDFNKIELAQRAKAIEEQNFSSNGAITQERDSSIGETGIMRPVWIGGE
jgi:hypothetical protein